jgi:hypothetical protein
MAEEVKIVDVAGGPAAEATLQELLKVMKGSSGGTGGGGPIYTQQQLLEVLNHKQKILKDLIKVPQH